MNSKIRILTIGLISIPIILLVLSGYEKHSLEYLMMKETTNDLHLEGILKAENDIDLLMDRIVLQDHEFYQESDTVVARILLELRALHEEAEFRNMDDAVYKEKFTKILDQLAYLEMEDGIAYMKNKEHLKAADALLKAKQHLLDADDMSKE